MLSLSTQIMAEDAPSSENSSLTTGYISDDLIIYMHAGPGKRFRILGSINSGAEISLTGKSDNEYTQIIDNKGRTTWVESKHVSLNPGLRDVIVELNGKLATLSDNENQVTNQLNVALDNISALENEKEKLNLKITALDKELIHTKSQLKNQDMNIKKEWFFNGAIVLSIGLLIGLIIPKLTGRRKASMDSWK